MEELNQRLLRLINSKEWSVEDQKWMLDYLEGNETTALQQILQQQFSETQPGGPDNADRAKKLLLVIHQRINPVPHKVSGSRSFFLKRVAVAALFLLIGGTAAFFLINQKPRSVEEAKSLLPVKEVSPGGNKAILTLGDGRTIVLDSARNGVLSEQGHVRIIKMDNGQLAYAASDLKERETTYNTISTPRGGQYQIVLADGSKVWLNAASSLRFPAAFPDKERKVELSGEAYFEVTKNISSPFRVQVNGSSANQGQVEVLGTHFNINSYFDEASVVTTLLEGKVKITAGNNIRFLDPGQQSELNKAGDLSLVKNADVEEVVAWKNGNFNFNMLDIPSIMRQISRWYNVEVVYKGKMTNETFSGIVSRSSSIKKVLKILEEGGAKFRMEGNKIIVE